MTTPLPDSDAAINGIDSTIVPDRRAQAHRRQHASSPVAQF